MLAALRQDVCKLCGARWIGSTSSIANSVRNDLTNAAVKSSFSTTSSQHRRSADIQRQSYIRSRVAQKHDRQPVKEPPGTFKLNSEQLDASSSAITVDDVLKQLNDRLRELAVHGSGSPEDSGQSMTGFVSALAKALGLDITELSGFARQWAETRPFPTPSDIKGKQREASIQEPQIEDVMSKMKVYGRIAIDRAVLSFFIQWLRRATTSGLIAASSQLVAVLEKLDLRFPEEWYPKARAMRRKLILHVGPTNSGKTYNALTALAKARTGAFAGPLRLLATEVFNRFNTGNIGGLSPDKPRVCNLITGEERRTLDPLAGLDSCTVEMMDLSKLYDVVVIDEIQMIANQERGFAWTHALLGLCANEIHLCGESSVVDLIKRIGAACGDEVIVNEYRRLSPLKVANMSLKGDLTKIQPGDCVVTFSRNNIFALKKEIEVICGLRVAVAYGGLPPEVREEQAKGFNTSDATSGYQVMVASDAIGMGLNLRIKRIVFETLEKWDGKQSVNLSVSQIKQLAGRAGRYAVASAAVAPSAPDMDPAAAKSTSNPHRKTDDSSNGIVTCLNQEDMKMLRTAMAAPMEPLSQASLQPLAGHIKSFISLLPEQTTQSQALEMFPVIASAGLDYSVPSFGPSLKVADLIKNVTGMTVEDRWIAAHSPVNTRDGESVQAYVDFMSSHAQGRPILITDWVIKRGQSGLLRLFRQAEMSANDERDTTSTSISPLRYASAKVAAYSTSLNLVRLEGLHRCLILYLWLHNRYVLHFPQYAEARLLKIETEEAIDFILRHMALTRRKTPRTDFGQNSSQAMGAVGAICSQASVVSATTG